ncbi:FKBP-type peptidyl-prolyl cis-trans isomerase [Shewanella marina]|uniref:FKBP-type peptidyl-prolyl cis-trans isomerase n=1 Tax=Shewanella marina TaxID=487319 RepID=UPI0004721A1B|nr:FKBP-type peptidyl-prolyl cis-trans isomerase [Shewanella marina]
MTGARSLLCHMDIVLEDGSIAESTKQSGKPVWLNVGDNSLSPEFEAQIGQLQQGDKHQFILQPEAAFGPINPDAIHYLERSRFPADMVLEPGVIISFTGPANSEIPGMVRDVAADSVTVDLNHPLAGQVLKFELEVVQVG